MRGPQDKVSRVDRDKLYLMIRLARYEQRNRSRALRINQCFRSDFVGYALLRNFLLTTIGYMLLLAVIALIRLEYLLSNFNNMNFVPIIAIAIVGYLVVLGVYTVITYTIASLRFTRMENSIRQYDRQLGKLEDIYRGRAHARRQRSSRDGRQKE